MASGGKPWPRVPGRPAIPNHDKVGKQNCTESVVGAYGYNSRNHRGQMIVNFHEKEGFSLMYSLLKKRPQRRWTWQSPDTMTSP